MNNKNNILYTVADIEKYHQGLLTPAEQHRLEKAALDDEMLADALEGYGFTQNAVADLADMQKRLKARIQNEDNKIEAPVKKLNNYKQWLKIAALVIILAGAGTIVLLNNKNGTEKSIAQTKNSDKKTNNEQENAVNLLTDSNAATSTGTPTPSVTTPPSFTPTPVVPELKPELTDATVAPSVAIPLKKEEAAKKTIEVPVAAPGNKIIAPVSDAKSSELESLRIANNNKELEEVVVNGYAIQKKTTFTGSSSIIKAVPEAKQAQPSVITAPNKELTYNKTDDQTLRSKTVSANDLSKLYFSGKITDNNQQPVPAASIVNIKNNQRVTADKNGHFKMPVTDSVIGISVNALGYQQNYFQLKQNDSYYGITLEPATNALNEVVVVGYGNTRKRSTTKKDKKAAQATNTSSLSPQPTSGWKAFEEYYKKNSTLPLLPAENAPAVFLTFTIDNTGTPQNIEVLVPLSDTYNKEAVRLLKTAGLWAPAPYYQKIVTKISFSK